MFPIARVGDTTFCFAYCHGMKCCCHAGPGVNITGADTVWVEMKPLTRMGDKTVHTCPHCMTGMALGLSPTVWSQMKPHHHLTNPINETCGMGLQTTSCKTVLDSLL